jgi:hypothetical protein
MTLIVPQSEDQFISYPHQTELLKRTSAEGAYIRISTEIKANLSFVITCTETGQVIMEDIRDVFKVEFVSPHFTQWDELYELQNDGTWKIKWSWRISDIDGLLVRVRVLNTSIDRK